MKCSRVRCGIRWCVSLRLLLVSLLIVAPQFSRVQAAVLYAYPCTLAWDPSPDPSVAGYKVYYGPNDGSPQNWVDATNKTTVTLNNLLVGTDYSVSVVVYDTNFNESGLSDPLDFTATALAPLSIVPAPDGTVQVQSQAAANTLCNIEFSDSLNPSNWQFLEQTNAQADGSLLFVDSAGMSAPSRFYRSYIPSAISTIPPFLIYAAPYTLNWLPSANTDVIGYTVTYSLLGSDSTTSQDVGLATSLTLNDLLALTNYYFQVTAYDATGAVIDTVLQLVDTPPALTPLQLTALADGTMQLQCRAAPGTLIWVECASALNPAQWLTLGSATSDGNGNFIYTDPPQNLPPTRYYRVVIGSSQAPAPFAAAPYFLSWPQSSVPTVVGYVLYYIPSNQSVPLTRLDMGNANSATIFGLTSGKTYDFLVTGYDINGFEMTTDYSLSDNPQ